MSRRIHESNTIQIEIGTPPPDESAIDYKVWRVGTYTPSSPADLPGEIFRSSRRFKRRFALEALARTS
ncbi:hypothetical protein CROQUDRAFT_100239 [Cronartium quercuum f. sp. fusiforme G11]|uniref:Uncharacterized protein n=1 Tax=Cronartium quercuum f. sp. fusiforme G11 TaxID=708437 RepID=A0A9P6T5V8_9BASI|nr:hypothetical protein CROQUDRAFT_100239 [Cronartium quercuum f. sp. fusiforme G11]